jgi:hypothetical protein
MIQMKSFQKFHGFQKNNQPRSEKRIKKVEQQEKMAATVTFMGSEGVLMRIEVEDGGQFKSLGKNLAFFLYDNLEKTSCGDAAVNFCSTLARDYASATTQFPSKASNSNVEYIVNYEDGWKVTVRASKTHQSLDVEAFLALCKADPSKRPVPTSSKATRVVRKRNPSGYHVFGNHIREVMKQENLDMNPKSAMSEIGKRWRDLNPDEKEEWNKKAKDQALSE